MKLQSSITKTIYNLEFNESRPKERYRCPEPGCARSDRKNPKDLQYYPETKTAYCHKCTAAFFEYNKHEKINYIVPEWKNITNLSDKAVKWFTGRMISQKTLVKMKVYTDNEYFPQLKKESESIQFPFFKGEKLINIKSRGANKSFKLTSGAELIWYNFNAIVDAKEIIICEGEIDVLSWIEIGVDNVISVPNGANNRFDYIDTSIDLFDDIEKIYLATDNDAPGLQLREELIRRFGADRCFLINFKQYKDSNAYLIGFGGLELKKTLSEAKQVPIKGIVEIKSLYADIVDLYENGITRGAITRNSELDNLVTWELSRLLVVSGIPGMGKSEFVDYLITRLNLIYGWKVGLFSPENYPLKFHYRKLHEKFCGQKFHKSNDVDFDNVFEYIQDNFFYILDENDLTVDSVLKSAKALVKQKGIKILVLDPFNKLDHQYGSKNNETQYISKFLGTLTDFARFNNILVILVAHPRKMQRGEIPNLYDISGSAHFYNMSDYGIVVHREKDENGKMVNDVDIYVQKVKFNHLGQQGCAELCYNYNNGRYEKRGDVNDLDNSNWLQLPDNNDLSYEIDNFFGPISEMPF
jgi:twinkle protein